jgi:hypothetical protein
MLDKSSLAEATQQRLALHANGLTPVPIVGIDVNIKSAGKRPPPELRDWPRECANASASDIESYARRFPTCSNTGLLCGDIIGVDIDVLHPLVRDKLLKRAFEVLGPTPLQRVGRAPKILLMYRVELAGDEQPPTKQQTADLFFGDDVTDADLKAKVEILASGQQFVAHGLHPVTREPYVWPDKSPIDIPLHEMPLVSCEKLFRFRDEAEKILREEGARTEGEINDAYIKWERSVGATVYGDRPSREAIVSALQFVGNDFGRDDYIKVLYAIRDGLGDGGYEVAKRWAQIHDSYESGNFESDWKSTTKRRAVTYRTLFKLASVKGWKNPDLPKAKFRSEAASAKAPPTEPLPLIRERPPATPFPIEALRGVLGEAAKAIHDKIQSPIAICGQSVLAAAALVTQGYANVMLPMGHQKPLSCFLITVAASGERKTATDTEALNAVRKREKELKDEYDVLKERYKLAMAAWEKAHDTAIKKGGDDQAQIQAALKAIGPEPRPPLLPKLTCSEPTFEGLFKQLMVLDRPAKGSSATRARRSSPDTACETRP